MGFSINLSAQNYAIFFSFFMVGRHPTPHDAEAEVPWGQGLLAFPPKGWFL